MSDSLICNSSTGACFCKANVDPTYCDTCLDGYWNISSTNPDGCQGNVCKNNYVISMCSLVQNVYVVHQEASVKIVTRHLAFAPTAWYTMLFTHAI